MYYRYMNYSKKFTHVLLHMNQPSNTYVADLLVLSDLFLSEVHPVLKISVVSPIHPYGSISHIPGDISVHYVVSTLLKLYILS